MQRGRMCVWPELAQCVSLWKLNVSLHPASRTRPVRVLTCAEMSSERVLLILISSLQSNLSLFNLHRHPNVLQNCSDRTDTFAFTQINPNHPFIFLHKRHVCVCWKPLCCCLVSRVLWMVLAHCCAVVRFFSVVSTVGVCSPTSLHAEETLLKLA